MNILISILSMVRIERKSKTPRVVIVGGGFGGLGCGQSPGKRAGRSHSHRSNEPFVFAPLLYSVSDRSPRAVADEFATPRGIAKTQEYDGDHGRGHRRG